MIVTPISPWNNLGTLNISNDGNIRLKMKIKVGIDANKGKIKEKTLLTVVSDVISLAPYQDFIIKK